MQDLAVVLALLSIALVVFVIVSVIVRLVFKKGLTFKKIGIVMGATFMVFVASVALMEPSEKTETVSAEVEVEETEPEEEPEPIEEEPIEEVEAVEEEPIEEHEEVIEEPTQEVVTSQKKEEKPEKPNFKDLKQITEEGGLGDTIEVFESYYGRDSLPENAYMNNYANDAFLVTPMEGRVYQLTIQMEATEYQRAQLDQALSLAKHMMPKDAEEVDYFTHPDEMYERHIFVYESEMLNGVFEDNAFVDTSHFSVIMQQDNRGVFGIILSLGKYDPDA